MIKIHLVSKYKEQHPNAMGPVLRDLEPNSWPSFSNRRAFIKQRCWPPWTGTVQAGIIHRSKVWVWSKSHVFAHLFRTGLPPRRVQCWGAAHSAPHLVLIPVASLLNRPNELPPHPSAGRARGGPASRCLQSGVQRKWFSWVWTKNWAWFWWERGFPAGTWEGWVCLGHRGRGQPGRHGADTHRPARQLIFLGAGWLCLCLEVTFLTTTLAHTPVPSRSKHPVLFHYSPYHSRGYITVWWCDK